MPHARLIVNPAAGVGRGTRMWPRIASTLKGLGFRFEPDFTEAPGHGVELAKSAAQTGYELVVAVGGDGTVNEVVNGLFDAGALGHVAIGVISVGTGCDCVRTLGIPHQYTEACQHLINPKTVAVDVGVAEYSASGQTVKRLFLNSAGLGLDAEVMETLRRPFKVPGRRCRYLVALLATLLSYRNRSVTFRINGESICQKVCMIEMSNGKYFGGGMQIAPQADPTDGFLDTLIIGDMSKLELLRALPRVYKGAHLSHPKVTLRKVTEIEIESEERLSIEADGELLGETPARFYVLPQAVKVVL